MTTGKKLPYGAPIDERFAGFWGRHYLLMWGTNITSFMSVELCRKGPKPLGKLVNFDITYGGKHWAYRGTISCSYNVKKCPGCIINVLQIAVTYNRLAASTTRAFSGLTVLFNTILLFGVSNIWYTWTISFDEFFLILNLIFHLNIDSQGITLPFVTWSIKRAFLGGGFIHFCASLGEHT